MWNKLADGKWKRYLPYGLMTVGLGLLFYVGSQYATMYAEQRRLAHEFEAQQQAALEHKSSPEVKRAMSDGLIRLSIPKINLQAIVVEGTSRKQLLVGLGHIKETAAPGQPGNAVITAHRDTFFRHIHELAKGDSVLVERDGMTYKYEVTGKRIVDPEDVSVLRPQHERQLTLITCYPTYYIGPAPERLVVFSKMVDQQPATPSASLDKKPATAPAAVAVGAH